ncbi:hypothetical protein RF11_03511 [Thelohanellus kitauei]|uniref:Uncharacterized protein n=1 Tax=Thelohanellus kitauei TaxID=669202 RepID=A0A0C2J6U2_THEKT|nr:hypothetical protein RF11_03511 [Thelohanellus kitauei]
MKTAPQSYAAKFKLEFIKIGKSNHVAERKISSTISVTRNINHQKMELCTCQRRRRGMRLESSSYKQENITTDSSGSVRVFVPVPRLCTQPELTVTRFGWSFTNLRPYLISEHQIRKVRPWDQYETNMTPPIDICWKNSGATQSILLNLESKNSLDLIYIPIGVARFQRLTDSVVDNPCQTALKRVWAK